MKKEFAKSAQKAAPTDEQVINLATIMRLTDIVGPVHEDEAGNRFCYRIERSDLINRENLYSIFQATEALDGKISDIKIMIEDSTDPSQLVEASSDPSQVARFFLKLESQANPSSEYPRLSNQGLLMFCFSEGVMPVSDAIDAINDERPLRQRSAQAWGTCPSRPITTSMATIAASHKAQVPKRKPKLKTERGGKPQLPILRN